MKKRIAIILLLNVTIFSAFAQHLEIPKTNWQAYGFQQAVEQVALGYYKSDSLGYEPIMLEVYTFNKTGNLIQKYTRIFGQYESETAYNYVYNDNGLDSINTIVSAKNFNTKQKLHYNQNGVLDEIKATGVYSSFTDQFSYDAHGVINTIERKHKSGGRTQTFFNTEKDYVQEKQIDLAGNVTANYYIYDGDQLFAFISESDSLITFYDAFHRTDFEIKATEDALNYTLNWRDLKNKNSEEFLSKISELQYKPNSRIIFEIPVESTNENDDWIKRLQIDSSYGERSRQFVFRSIVYMDGTVSGSTEYDLMFQMQVSSIK